MPETPGLSKNPYKNKSLGTNEYQSQVGSPLINTDPGIVGTGVAGSEYDANTPLGDMGALGKIRSDRQSDWTAAGNMVLQSLSTVAGQSLDAVGSLLIGIPKMAYNAAKGNPQDYNNPLSEAGRDLQDWTQRMAPIFADPDRSFGHAAWWMQNAPSVASTMAMFIPQLGVAKAVGGLARWMRLSENATELAQIGLGALAGRHAENYMEAGSVFKNAYDDAISKGIDEETAKKNAGEAASLDYSMNYANLGFDVIELASVLKPFRGAGKALGKMDSFLGKNAAIADLGFEGANARSMDILGKSILDGTKWYEKAALQSFRFARPAIAQLGEGIEEGINTISQKEGERKARQLNGTATNEDNDSTFLDRLSKYAVDKDVAQSAFWGVVGGVVTHAAGVAYTKGKDLLRGKDADVTVGIKAADISARKEKITDYLKVQNDPTATPIEKLKARHKAIFNLSQSAINADNLDLLLGDMDDKQYQEILAKQSGIDSANIKGEITKLKDDISYISDAFDTYRGLSTSAWNKLNQKINTSSFADGEKQEMVKRGFFQFVEPDVATSLTEMDYYSHIANKTTLEANTNIHNEFQKINNGHPQFKPIMDNVLRAKAIDYSIDKYEKELDTMSKAGVSDTSLAITREQLDTLKTEKKNLKKALDGIESLVDYDYKMNGSQNGDEPIFNKLLQEVVTSGSVPAILNNYASIVDDQMTKLRFAKERSNIISNPEEHYSNWVKDAVNLKSYHQQIAADQKRYGFNETDSNNVKELKRKVVDTFDNTLTADDKRYRSADRAVYDQQYKDAYEGYAQSTEDLKAEQDRIIEELKNYDPNKPDTFDFAKYTTLRAQQDAVTKAINEKKPEVTETNTGTNTYNSEPVARADADFKAGIAEIIRRLQVLKDVTSDDGISANLGTAFIYQQLAAIKTEQDETERTKMQEELNDYLDHANETFVTVSFPFVQADAKKLITDLYATPEYNNEFLNVVNNIDKFISTLQNNADAFAGVEEEVQDEDEEAEAEVVQKQVVSKNDPDEILYDNTPEPIADTKVSQLLKSDEYDSYNAQNEEANGPASFTTSVTTNANNHGFVTVSHGTGFMDTDSKTNKPVYKDQVPVLSRKLEGNRQPYMIDLSLLDPNSDNYLQGGDKGEITMDGEWLQIWKVTDNGNRFRIGGVKKGYTINTAGIEHIKSLLEKEANKTLHFTLAPNAIGFGNIIHTEPVDASAPKKDQVFYNVPLQKAIPLSLLNKEGGAFLTINDGTNRGYRGAGNAMTPIQSSPSFPKRARVITKVKAERAGQLEIVIPTNVIPNGQTKNKKVNGKQIYQARLAKTNNVNTVKTKDGDNMAVALIKKLIDPYNNEAFIKSLEPITNIKFTEKPLVNQKTLLEQFYTSQNINFLMNQILHSRAAANKDDTTGMGFKYPFYVDVRRNKKLTVNGNDIIYPISLSVRFRKDRVPAYHYFGVGATNMNDTSVIAKMDEIKTITDVKPFRLDARKINMKYGEQAHIGFAVENGDLKLKRYENGYLQYMTENNMVHVNFAAIPYTYTKNGKVQTAHTFYDMPQIKLNLEDIKEFKPGVEVTDKTPKQAGIEIIKVGGTIEQDNIVQNDPKDVNAFLQDTQLLELTPDETQYQSKSNPDDKFQRVGNVLNKTFNQTDNDSFQSKRAELDNFQLPAKRKTISNINGNKLDLTLNTSKETLKENIEYIIDQFYNQSSGDKSLKAFSGIQMIKDTSKMTDENREYALQIIKDAFATKYNAELSASKNTRLEQAADFGSTIDSFVRDYFTDSTALDRISVLQSSEKYKGLSSSVMVNLRTGLQQLKKQFEANGERPYTDHRIVFDRKTKIAGELDILTIDKNNVIRSYDVKSFKGSMQDMIDNNDPRISKWTKQANSYRILAKNEHNVDISEMYIYGVSVGYGSENKNLVTLNIDGLMPLRKMDKVVGDNGTIEIRRDSKVDALITAMQNTKAPVSTIPVSMGSIFGVDFIIDKERTKISAYKNGRLLGEAKNTDEALKIAEDHFANAAFEDEEDSDVSKNVVGILTEMYNAKNVSSALMDPSVTGPRRNNLIDLMNASIMDVFYQEYLGKNQKKLNVTEQLMPMVLSNLKSKLAQLQKDLSSSIRTIQQMRENGDDESTVKAYENRFNKLPGYIAYYNEAVNKFDNSTFDEAAKKKVGEFIGYFKTSFYFVSGSKLIKNIMAEDDVYDLDTSDETRSEGLTAKHLDDWWAKINPKNTPTFQTKVFLSRIPKRIGSNFQLGPTGNHVYYSMDDVLDAVYKSVNEIRSDHFLEDLSKVDNPIIKDLISSLDEMEKLSAHTKFKWQFTREQMERKLASSAILQSRQITSVKARFNFNEAGEITSTSYNIFDSNRQGVDEEIISDWESEFRELQPDFYNIAIDEKDGIPNPKITGLKKRGIKTYDKPSKNTLDVSIPTVAEIGAMNGGSVSNALADSKYLIYLQLKQAADMAIADPENTHDIVLPVKEDDYTIRDTEGTELTSLAKSDVQELLNYIKWPGNIRFKKEDAARITNIELHSVRDAIKSILDMADNPNSYPPAAFVMLGDQLARVGINVSEKAEDRAKTLAKLQSGGDTPLFKQMDGGAKTLKSYLTDNTLNLVQNFITAAKPQKADEDEEVVNITDINTPFADYRLKLKNLAKMSKSGWPNIKSNNVVNSNGDKEWTVNPQSYLSTRINQFRNDENLRDKILNNPFSGRSNIIKELCTNPKALAQFNISYFGDISFGSYATSHKKMNDIKQLLTDYSLFHNQEKLDEGAVDTQARGVANYITAHGESKTAPKISLGKRDVQTDFTEDKNGKIGIALNTNSSFFSDLFSQFQSELDRVLHGQAVLNDLIKMSEEKSFEKAKNYAYANYKPGFHFALNDNSFLPGTAMKITMFGKNMFEDNRKLLYASNGHLLADIQKLKESPNDETILSSLKKTFKIYADEFLTNEIDSHIEQLEKYDDQFFKKGRVKLKGKGFEFFGARFPLFESRYIKKMNQQLVNGVNPVKVWGYNNEGQYVAENLKDKHLVQLRTGKLDTSGMTDADAKLQQDSYDNWNKEAEKSNFYEFHKRYIIADFIFNNLLFKNTYFQLTEDPADFNKADKYDTLKEEIDKRLKHHLGPGTQTAEQGDNELHVIYFNDVTPGHLKVEVGHNEYQALEHHTKQAINWMMNDNIKFKGKTLGDYIRQNATSYSLPSNYETLGALYAMYHNDKATLRSIMFDNLNQELTDAGSFMSRRETVVRMVKAGDISVENAPAIYNLLGKTDLNETIEDPNNSKNTTTPLEILNKKYGISSLLVNKFIYSGNKFNDYKEGNKIVSLNDFGVMKNSEVSLIKNLHTNLQWHSIIDDMEAVENGILKEKGIDPLSPQSFETALGVVLSPMSSRKSQGMGSIDLINEDGSYTGLLKTAPLTVYDRNYHREQQSKEIKEVNEVTASTQALPNSQMDITANIDFARVVNRNIKFDESYSNTQQNNARYAINEELMRRDLNDHFIKTGIRTVNGWPHIDDIRSFISNFRQQMVNQNGANPIVLESFKIDEQTGRLPIPISFTPWGITAQAVILNGFNKPITGKKMPGQSFIQATSLLTTADPTLKGFRLRPKRDGNLFDSPEAVRNYYTEEELAMGEDGKPWIEKVIEGGIEKYRGVVNEVLPAEIAISWRFTDAEGKLLDYDKYVNKNGTPKQELFDPEVLDIIGLRIPNTPHNTMAYLHVVKFIRPSHKDIAQVNPQLMTNMSSDLDVDTLNTYQFNTEILPSGKIVKVKGVVHRSQSGHESLLNTTKNKEEVRSRELHQDYDYVNFKKELVIKQREYLKIKERLQNALDADSNIPVEEILLDPKAKAKYIELLKEYNNVTSKITNPDEELRGLYYSILNGDVEATDAFKDKYEEAVNEISQNEDNEAVIEQQAKQAVIEYIGKLAGIVKDQEKQIKKGKGFQADPQFLELKNQLEREIGAVKEENQSAIEKLGNEDLESIKSKIKEIEDKFDATFDFSKISSVYKKQTRKQLENAMLDTFMLTYSNPNVFKKMIKPLSTEFLKDRLNDKTLQWYDADGKVKSTSILEGIVNKGYYSINGYQSQANFKNTSSENADLIGVFASTLRVVQIAQNQALFLAPSDELPSGPVYGKVEKNEDGIFIPKRFVMADGTKKVEIKTDVIPDAKTWHISDKKDNMIHSSTAVSYHYYDKAYKYAGLPVERKPDVTTHYRLDAIYDYDNFNRKINVSTTIEASLQAVLDGIKDPIAPKIKLTMSNVNAYVGHLMLRYYDEIVPLFHQPIIDKYERDVKQEGVKRSFATDEKKMSFLRKYISDNNLFDEKLIAKVFETVKNPILALERLLVDSNIVITSADLNNMLVKYHGLDGTDRKSLLQGSDFHTKQLAALLNYLRADKIGQQFTTLHIALNTFSKGGPGNILEWNDKSEAFKDLHRLETVKSDTGEVKIVDGKPLFKLTSSVPNIGNIQTISKLLQQGVKNVDTSKKSFYELPVSNVLLPVQYLFKNMDNTVFTELTPLFDKMYTRYDELRKKSDDRSKPGKRTKLSTFLTSYVWSNPELYKDMFDNEAEYEYFVQYGRDAIMIHSDAAKKALEEVDNKKLFVFPNTLATAAKALANERFAKTGESYGSVYKLLNAFKYITGGSKIGSPDFILYMNIADYKGTFENELAMSIPLMLESKDVRVRALAKQLVIYAHLGGGISTPNSFIKHIPQSVRDQFGMSKRLRDYLDGVNNGKTESDIKRRYDIIQSSLVSYFKHYPMEAPTFNTKYLRAKDSKTKNIFFQDPETKRSTAFTQADKDWIFERDTFVARLSGTDKIYAYTKIDGAGAMVELDKLGKSRWNWNENTYTEDDTNVGGGSIIYENMAGSVKRDLLYGKRVLAKTNDMKDGFTKADYYSWWMESIPEERTAFSLMDSLLEHTDNEAYRTLLRDLKNIENAQIGVDLQDVSTVSEVVAGQYNQVTDRIVLNKDVFFNGDEANIPGFEKTAIHEIMHAQLDRSITSVLLPERKFDSGRIDEQGKAVMFNFLTKTQKGLMEAPVQNITKIIGLLNVIRATDGMTGNDIIANQIADYERYASTDAYNADQLDYVNFFKRLEEFTNKGYSLTNPKKANKKEMEELAALVKEFSAYFMTNAKFQELMNDITIDVDLQGEFKEATKGSKNIWQAIMKWFMDILNLLTDGNMTSVQTINARGILETSINENTIAHVAAANILSLIHDAKAPNKKARAAIKEVALQTENKENDISNNIVRPSISAFNFSETELDDVDAIGNCK